jgi:hypothetical protein
VKAITLSALDGLADELCWATNSTSGSVISVPISRLLNHYG